MSTNIRPSISHKSPYYISKHRYYELKHFCLQYKEWEKEYADLSFIKSHMPNATDGKSSMSDNTSAIAIKMAIISKNMEMVKKCSINSDASLAPFIFKAVTEGRSYTYLSNVLGIPCGKDMYYDRYRKFFFLLSQE